jgi:hypothetical protein
MVDNIGATYCSSGNHVVLSAGTYYARFWAHGHQVNEHQAQLYNKQAGSVILHGSSSYARKCSTYSMYEQTLSMGEGAFTLGSQQCVSVRHLAQCTASNSGGGRSLCYGSYLNSSDYTYDTHMSLEIWKVDS